MEKNINGLIELGIFYSDVTKEEIEKLDRLSIDTVTFKQEAFYSDFMGTPDKFSIDSKWNVRRDAPSHNILANYTVEELKNILKGIIIYEVFIGRSATSVSASVPVFFELASINYNEAFKFLEWTEFFNYGNSHFPYGERSKIAFYQYVYKYSNEQRTVDKMKVELQVAGYIKF